MDIEAFDVEFFDLEQPNPELSGRDSGSGLSCVPDIIPTFSYSIHLLVTYA